MAALPPSLVYEGFWVDHSVGSVLGATLTLSSSHANIVLVVLTLIIAFAGSHLWDLVAFLNFLSKSTDSSRDGIHHQIQLLLRNASSPSTYAWECIKIAFYWRFGIRSRWSRLVYTTILALICSWGFIAAGILSSTTLSSGSVPVLVRPLYCGYWPDNITEQTSDKLTSYDLYAKTMSWTYAKKCYGEDTAKDPACNIYTQPAVNFASSYDVCPFGDACLPTNNSTITMDTGLANSNLVFGINSKMDDTVGLRIQTTCGVIDSDRYMSKVPYSELGFPFPAIVPDQMDWIWNFGTQAQTYNFTFAVSTYHVNATEMFELFSTFHFQPAHGMPELTENGLKPLPPFNRNDSDFFLFLLLGNGVYFGEPVDDPLFSAHAQMKKVTNLGTSDYYISDSPGKALGCIQKYQICTPAGKCTSIASVSQMLEDAQNLGMNAIQMATVRHFEDQISPEMYANNIMDAAVMTPPALQLAQVGGTGQLFSVPNNQWEIEAKGMFSLMLARLQKGIADIATGPLGSGTDEDYYNYSQAPTDPAGLILCNNQRMKAPNGFSNINVFGLAFTVGLCGLIILVNLIATPAMKIIARHNKPMSVGMRHWISDGMLQVQRKAFQLEDRGDWRRFEYDIPVTRSLELFPGLGVEGDHHGVSAPKSHVITTTTAVSSDGEGNSSSVTPSREASNADVSEDADRVNARRAATT